ncbi:MAG TPA: sigma-54 dependent transcriptional regulator [Phycisphaerales bacterium]|nr:sigma-54 dependent transcriptional regulator [Phycisphaerales bacterium]
MAVASSIKVDTRSGSGPAAGTAAPLVGGGPAMQRLKGMIAAVAPRDCTVLIHGESGAGKELTARTIHGQSRRASGPFVAVDCTGLRDTLLESQLFGHVKGAFTGADGPSLGFIRAADGGTLFLDEIGELELKTQAKLLRCIQERSVVPLGSVKPIHVDVRVVCATHRNLREMASRGEFREDLLFRLDVVQVRLPSLRERSEDITALAQHFLRQLAELYGEGERVLSHEAAAALQRYQWPGNVRELANALEHAAVFCQGGVIQLSDLPERVREAGAVPTPTASPITVSDDAASVVTLESMERDLISRALRLTDGNQNRAAGLLAVERRRLYRKVAKYNLKHLTNGIADAE